MATLTETRRQSPTTLVGLIGRETLQAIQDAFATAFDIPTVILDHEGRNVNEITFRVKLCEDLTRTSTAGSRCLACDVRAMRTSERTNRPTTFECWNGLHDSTIPIVSSDGRLFGHFLAGQVLTKEPLDLSRWAATAATIGVDVDEYLHAVRDLRVIPEAVYRHRIDCLGILARMIADQASAALANRVALDAALTATEQTERLTAELETIASNVSLTTGADDLYATIAHLVDAAHEVIPFAGCSVHVRRSEGQEALPILLRDGADADYASAVTHGLESAAPAIMNDGLTISVPLVLDGESLGALVARHEADRRFSSHDRDLFTIVGGQIATAIGISRLRADTLRIVAVTATRDAELRQLAADVDPEPILTRLLDEAALTLEADAARLIPRDPELPAIMRSASDEARQHDAAFLGALSRARASGRPTISPDGASAGALIVPAAPAGSRSGFDLVLWRATSWSDRDTELARSFATGVELVAESQRRQRLQRRAADRQRAMMDLIAVARRSGLADLDTVDRLAIAAIGLDGIVWVHRSDMEGALVAYHRTDDAPLAATLIAAHGNPSLLPPELPHDGSQWEHWGQRIASELGLPRRDAAVCIPIGTESGPLALIGLLRGGRTDELHARAESVADVVALSTPSAASIERAPDTRLLQRRLRRRVREGTSAVQADIVALYRGLTGAQDAAVVSSSAVAPGDVAIVRLPDSDMVLTGSASPPPLWNAISEDFADAADLALCVAGELEEARQLRNDARAQRQRIAGRLDRLRRERQLVHATAHDLLHHDPAAAFLDQLAERERCAVLLEDGDGALLAGDAAAANGAALEIVGEGGEVLGRLRRADGAAWDDCSWERLLATLILRRHQEALDHDTRHRAAVVDALIDAEALSSDLARRCREFGFEPTQRARVAVLELTSADDDVERGVRLAAAWVRRQAEVGAVGRRGRQVIVIGPDDAGWFDRLASDLGSRGDGICLGLGHPTSGPPATMRSYVSGRQAAEVLRVTGRRGVLEISDDSIESMLLEAAEPARLVRFVESILRPLEEHDASRTSDFVGTLEAVVAQGWNLQAAARSCHIHVSTLRYRLGRIEALAGVDLAEPDGRLTVELALRGRRVIDGPLRTT